MNWPKISVVVPSYNQAHYLEQTLCSVLEQSYPNLELIVMDGGSSDGSVDIIRRYADRIAYWVSERDGGQTAALIAGFACSTGDIQCWLNSDDLHERDTLEKVAGFFREQKNAEFVFGNCSWIDPNGNFLYYRREMGFNRWLWLYAYNFIPQPATFWTRSLYERVGGLDPTFLLAMDGDLFARFSRDTKVCHIDAPLARFRYYPEQRNQRLRETSDREDRRILNRELNRNVSGLEKAVLGLAARAVRYGYRSIFL